LGVHAEINGRNDMTISGKKFSGNSQYIKQGRIMHHGTIMYDCDLDVVEKALTVSKDKIESKGLKSVRSRVVNVRPYMADRDMPVEQFIEALRTFMFARNHIEYYNLTPEDVNAVTELQKQVYDRWEWNYGVSPAFQLRKERRVEQCGKLEVFLDVQEGVIQDIAIYGDYFGSGATSELKNLLLGCQLKEERLREVLERVTIGNYFCNMDTETFLSILLQ
jgi:lipoate-protein ligase A